MGHPVYRGIKELSKAKQGLEVEPAWQKNSTDVYICFSLVRVRRTDFGNHPSIGSNHVHSMLNRKPACLTRTPISAQQNLHV